MKTIVFTHNDLDGVACGIVALHYFPDANVHYCSYQNIEDVIHMFLKLNEGLLNDYRIIISDISFKKDSDIARELNCRHLGSLIIADHHKTSLWMSHYPFTAKSVYRSIESDGDYSAALLLHNLLADTHCGNTINGEEFGDKLSKALTLMSKIVSDWDTWNWTNNLDHTDVVASMKTNTSYFLSTLMNTVSISAFVSRIMMGLRSSKNLVYGSEPDDFLAFLLGVFTDEELNNTKAVIANSFELMRNLEIVNKRIRTKEYGEIQFSYVALQDYSQTSIASEYIRQTELMDPNSKFLAMVSGNNPKGVSLRLGAKDIDLSVIASEFGGGGHVNAAGCDFFEFTKNVIEG